MNEKKRPPRRKGKGNTGITATHITVWTMNHEPMPEEIIQEVEAFLGGIVQRNGSRLLVALTKV
jgi:hypothetical protein